MMTVLGKMKKEAFTAYVFPVVYGGFGLYCLLHVHQGLTVDGYIVVSSASRILSELAHTGYGAGLWPPLYPLLVGIVGLVLELELGAKVLSLFAAVGILTCLPFLTRFLNLGFLPGLFLQPLLGFNASFLDVSLQAETHMLDAFLFTLSVYFGLKYFVRPSTGSLKFLTVFTILACMTRYSSWVLIPVLTIVFWSSDNFKSRSPSIPVSVLLMVTCCLGWSLYNFFLNGFLISGQKSGGSVAGLGMSEAGLLDYTPYTWVHSGYFKYSSLGDLVQTFPREYVSHLVANTLTIVKFGIFDFPPLGMFSCLIAVGLIGVLIRSFRSEYFFLLLVIVSYSGLIVIIRYQWVYLIHLGVILAALGMGFLWNFGLRYFSRYKLIVLLVAVILVQGGSQFDDVEQLLGNGFRRAWAPSDTIQRVEDRVKELNRNVGKPSKTVRVMLNYVFIPNLYKHGFSLVTMPLPDRPAAEFLCYGGLSTEQIQFYKHLNYPANMELREYLPPDYLVVTPFLRSLVPSVELPIAPGLNGLLRPVQPSDRKARVRIYEVRTETLNCST